MKKYIIGADEVGYGAGAGEIFVCGVKALFYWELDGLKDSKKLTVNQRSKMRLKLDEQINNNEIQYYLASRDNDYIDKYGLGNALKGCYLEIFRGLNDPESKIIVDGNIKFNPDHIKDYDIQCMIKADTKIPTVMAASIIAKTTRDQIMWKCHKLYPQYDWINNVGYLSPNHILAIKKYGLSPLHRKSYKIKGIS